MRERAAYEVLPRRRPVAFLYSGHGAQTFHMGRSIYEADPDFRAEMECLDAAIGRHVGVSILASMYDDRQTKADSFDKFRLSHPAIFMVEYALSRVLIDRFGPPDILLGASLGELVAATVAGSVSLDQALELVVHQTRAMATDDGVGGMLAIFSPPSFYDQNPEVARRAEIATTVDETHFVVSGDKPDLLEIEHYLEQQNVECLRLPVNLPFHSSRIEPFKPRLTSMPDWRVQESTIPVLSCSTCSFMPAYTKDHMWATVRQPLRIGDMLSILPEAADWVFVDLGPGSTLVSALARSGAVSPKSLMRIQTAFGNEMTNFSKLCAALSAQREHEALQ